MKNALIILSLVVLSAIGCKVETVAPAQYPQAQAPKPESTQTVQKESPTFMQCADSGYEKSKELAVKAYDAAAPVVSGLADDAKKAYNDWQKEQEKKDDKSSSEP